MPGVSITHQQSTDPNATITIPVGHTKYGYYYCQIQNRGSTLATGFTVIEIKCKQILNCRKTHCTFAFHMNICYFIIALLFSSQLKLKSSTGASVTLNLNKTVTSINSYLYQLNWYHDMTRTNFGVPLESDSTKYLLSTDNMSLTIMNIDAHDAGVYRARYDGLLLYPHNKTCEHQLLRALRHYPVLQPVTFTLSVGGSGENGTFEFRLHSA